jgi:VIT1/CCC1 family predicted Fe2+/Mn2+ transporter
MKDSVKIGMNFGATSGVITTLGLIVGLHASTQSRLAVIGGILTIAIADALSDAFGIHLSEESQQEKSHIHAWTTTLYTFLFKFMITGSFLLPLLMCDTITAIYWSILWGILILLILSYRIAKNKNMKPWTPIGEHLLVAAIVIILTHVTGKWISVYFH